MQLDSKTQKVHNIIKYKAYTALIEGKIDQAQYEMLAEIGFLDKIKSFFGAGADVGKDLAKLFKDKSAQRQLNTAKENITKAIQDLRDIASKAGVDESVVNEFLQGVLKGADVNPAEVASATKAGGEGEKSTEPTKGETVTSQAIEKNPAVITKIVADVTGQDPEKVGAELEKKKPDVASISGVLGKAIGQDIKVDGKIVTSVIKALIDKGHLKLENGNPVTRSGLIKFINEVKSLNEQADLLDRWQVLAGVEASNQVNEETLAGKLANDIVAGKIKTPEELKKAASGIFGQTKLTPDEVSKLVDLLPKDEPGKAKEPKPVKKDVEEKIKKIVPDAKKEEPKQDAKKEFGQAFKDVRAVIKPEEADDDTLNKVITAIDGYKSVQIAA